MGEIGTYGQYFYFFIFFYHKLHLNGFKLWKKNLESLPKNYRVTDIFRLGWYTQITCIMFASVFFVNKKIIHYSAYHLEGRVNIYSVYRQFFIPRFHTVMQIFFIRLLVFHV